MHQFTPLKKPQLNGLAERMEKIIVGRVRCFLSSANSQKHCWGEALSNVVYLIILSQSCVLQGDVPNRLYYGKDVASYDHLKVFGCKVFFSYPSR
jgi:hypothetical protein